jgi:hypothetical protein
MPLKLNVGLSRKLGLPDYGSLGASCSVELELEASALENLDSFQARVKHAYNACRQAVSEELARHQPASGGPPGAQETVAAGTNGHSSRPTSASSHRASGKQVDYARQLAVQIRGLGARRLEALAEKLYHKPLADLTSLDASGLIDTLKAMKAGEIDVQAALNGAAS